MWKKIAIAGSVGVVVLGAGTASLAATGAGPSPSPSASSSSGGTSPSTAHKGAGGVLRHALHAQWTTRESKGSSTFVQHDAIRGSVTAVSPTSITVVATDGVPETYVLTSSTKVHGRGEAKGTAGTLNSIHVGDTVAVRGTGSSTLTATAVIDRGMKTPPSSG